MLKYDCYKIGAKPNKLVVFLHGYNGTPTDHDYALQWLRQYLQNSLLVVPIAPEESEKNAQKRQWFGVREYDPDNIRTNPQTSVAEIFDIYNCAAHKADGCAVLINDFIGQMQKKYAISEENTYLCGFSQGAMLTVYAALSRNAKLGGAFALSGLIVGADMLALKIKSRPPLYLFHGQDDLKVQYKTLPYSVKWLENNGIMPEVHTFAGLAHRMNEAEMRKIAEIINCNATVK